LAAGILRYLVYVSSFDGDQPSLRIRCGGVIQEGHLPFLRDILWPGCSAA
jgi:hypothetical protein